MKSSGINVVINAGAVAPKAFIDVALKDFTSFAGYAFPNPKEGKVFIGNLNGTEDWTSFNAQQEECKDVALVACFGRSETALQEADIPPYVLLKTAAGEPALVAMMEGEFPLFTEEKSAHLDIFFAAYKWLLPKFQAVWDATDQDIDKMMAYIQKPTVLEEINRQLIKRAAITLVGANGKIIHINNDNPLSRAYAWGYSTNHLGYAETTVVEKALGATATGLRAKLAQMGGRAPAPAAPKPEPETVVHKEAATERNPPPTDEVEMWIPPKHLHGKALKKGYRQACGFLPDDWEDRPAAPKRGASGSYKNLGDVKPKDMPAVHPAEIEPAKSPVPVIPAKARTEIEKHLEQQVDGVDPNTLQKQETPTTTFAEAMGIDFQTTHNWPFRSLADMGYISPEALAVLTMDYRREYLKLKSKMVDTIDNRTRDQIRQKLGLAQKTA